MLTSLFSLRLNIIRNRGPIVAGTMYIVVGYCANVLLVPGTVYQRLS